jgi:hypothetical protein
MISSSSQQIINDTVTILFSAEFVEEFGYCLGKGFFVPALNSVLTMLLQIPCTQKKKCTLVVTCGQMFLVHQMCAIYLII